MGTLFADRVAILLPLSLSHNLVLLQEQGLQPALTRIFQRSFLPTDVALSHLVVHSLASKNIKIYYREIDGTSGTLGAPDNPLTAGTYRTNIINLYATTLTISGNVILIVYDVPGKHGPIGGTVDMRNGSQIVILPGGSLELYITRMATFAETSVINPPCRLLPPPCPSPSTVKSFLSFWLPFHKK